MNTDSLTHTVLRCTHSGGCVFTLLLVNPLINDHRIHVWKSETVCFGKDTQILLCLIYVFPTMQYSRHSRVGLRHPGLAGLHVWRGDVPSNITACFILNMMQCCVECDVNFILRLFTSSDQYSDSQNILIVWKFQIEIHCIVQDKWSFRGSFFFLSLLHFINIHRKAGQSYIMKLAPFFAFALKNRSLKRFLHKYIKL